jgi:hypothetical protein
LVAREAPLPKIEHRYHVVRGLRAKNRKGMDLNKEGVVPVTSREGFCVKGDDRFTLNSNSFKVDKGRNVSGAVFGTSSHYFFPKTLKFLLLPTYLFVTELRSFYFCPHCTYIANQQLSFYK